MVTFTASSKLSDFIALGTLASTENFQCTNPAITDWTTLLSYLRTVSNRLNLTVDFVLNYQDEEYITYPVNVTINDNGDGIDFFGFEPGNKSVFNMTIISPTEVVGWTQSLGGNNNDVYLTTPELQKLRYGATMYAEHPTLNNTDQAALNKITNGNYWEVITKCKFYFLNLDTDNDSTWIMPISVNFQGWKEDTDLQLINISFCYYDSLVCLELLKSEGSWEVGNYIEKSIKDITNTYIVPYNPYTRFGVGDTILSDFLNRIKNQNQRYSEDGLIFFCKYYEAGESGFTQVSFPISCYANYSNSIIVISFIHGTSAWVIRADIRGKVTNKFEKSLVS